MYTSEMMRCESNVIQFNVIIFQFCITILSFYLMIFFSYVVKIVLLCWSMLGLLIFFFYFILCLFLFRQILTWFVQNIRLHLFCQNTRLLFNEEIALFPTESWQLRQLPMLTSKALTPCQNKCQSSKVSQLIDKLRRGGLQGLTPCTFKDLNSWIN